MPADDPDAPDAPGDPDTHDTLRAQLKVTKRMLEVQHGQAMRHGSDAEERAYYDAIGLVDDALQYRWITDPDYDPMYGLIGEFIAESREARDGDYTAPMPWERPADNHDEAASGEWLGRLLDRLRSGWCNR